MKLKKVVRKSVNIIRNPKHYFKSLDFLKTRSNLIHNIAPYTWLDDKFWLEFYFCQHFGYRLDFKNLKTFNEKIQWMKMYDRNPLYTRLADKYHVRDYVSEHIGNEFLTDLYHVYNDVNDICWNKIPYPCVIKPNNGAGWIIFHEDENKFDEFEAKRNLLFWQDTNFYKRYREWQYKNISYKILIEQKLNGNKQLGLIDYKFFCFNGKPILIQVNIDRFSNFALLFFDIEWNQLPLSLEHYNNSNRIIKKPDRLKDMIEISSKLSNGLNFCRVDLYEQNSQIVFGEMTLTPNAGLLKFYPPGYDEFLGQLLKLPRN